MTHHKSLFARCVRAFAFLGAFGIASAAFAFGPVPATDASCDTEPGSPTTNGELTAPATAIPRLATPEEINFDRDWPIVAQWTKQLTDDHGRPITSTITMRLPPGSPRVSPSRSSPLPVGPIAAAAACTSLDDPTFTMDTPTSNQQFWMHSKFFLHRERAGTYPGTDWVYAYRSTRTIVWWTRSDTNYDVFAGEQTNTWFYNAINCNTWYSDPHSASGGNWIPSWETSGKTYEYIYTSPMDSWPVLFNPLYAGYDIHYSQTTNVAYLGERYASLSNSFVPAKQ